MLFFFTSSPLTPAAVVAACGFGANPIPAAPCLPLFVRGFSMLTWVLLISICSTWCTTKERQQRKEQKCALPLRPSSLPGRRACVQPLGGGSLLPMQPPLELRLERHAASWLTPSCSLTSTAPTNRGLEGAPLLLRSEVCSRRSSTGGITGVRISHSSVCVLRRSSELRSRPARLGSGLTAAPSLLTARANHHLPFCDILLRTKLPIKSSFPVRQPPRHSFPQPPIPFTHLQISTLGWWISLSSHLPAMPHKESAHRSST